MVFYVTYSRPDETTHTYVASEVRLKHNTEIYAHPERPDNHSSGDKLTFLIQLHVFTINKQKHFYCVDSVLL